MKVIFTSETKEDFRKHNDYVRKQKKSDGHKYQSYELKGINKSFKKNLGENLEKIKEPKDSIFPKEFEYSSDSHKMYVDKKSHYVVFYTVETTKSGEKIMKVRRNIHSTELKKELEERGIKPLKDCDKSLLDDLETVYKEDDVKSKDDFDEELEEDTDKEGNPRQHKTGPEGGKYYRVKIDGKWGPWNSETSESLKDIKDLIIESNIISLSSYLNERLSC
ncbi:MAG: hypothetical protein IJ998_03090 [Alistipes sp.]|nr:hypothetical protein [Alistipes sp.]